jgi:hypothetical protein
MTATGCGWKSNAKLRWRMPGGGMYVTTTDASGGTVKDMIYFAGQQVAQRVVSGSVVSYYFSDQVGSVRLMVDATASPCGCPTLCGFCSKGGNHGLRHQVGCDKVEVPFLHCTTMVYNDAMPATKAVRRSVTLPAQVAKQVDRMAKRRRLSDNRVLLELIEEGIEAQKQKEKSFRELAERFRASADPKEVKRLGDQLGRFVFGE